MKPGRIRFRKTLYLLALVALLFYVSAGLQAATGGTRVRIIHLATAPNAVEVWVEGRLIDQNLEFGQSTGYIDLAPGKRRIICKTAKGGDSIVLNSLFPFRKKKDYTFVLTGGKRSELQLIPTLDSCPPSKNLAQIKFTDVVTNLPPIDVSIEYGPTLYTKLTFRTGGGCRLIPPNKYVLGFTESRTGKLVAKKEINLKGGYRYNFFAARKENQKGINLFEFKMENRPKQEPKIFGVERSVLQLLGAGLIASVLILVLGQ